MRIDLTKETRTLASMRLRENLSFRELAEQIGVGEQALYRLMARRPVANDRTAYQIQRFLSRRKRRRVA